MKKLIAIAVFKFFSLLLYSSVCCQQSFIVDTLIYDGNNELVIYYQIPFPGQVEFLLYEDTLIDVNVADNFLRKSKPISQTAFAQGQVTQTEETIWADNRTSMYKQKHLLTCKATIPTNKLRPRHLYTYCFVYKGKKTVSRFQIAATETDIRILDSKPPTP